MTNPVYIKYNKGFSYISMIGLVLLIVFINTIEVKDKRGILATNLLLGLFLIYFYFKFFLPMIKGKIAIKLDHYGIQNFVRNQKSSWNNVIEIRELNFYRGGKGIGIILVNNNEYIKTQNYYRKLLSRLNIYQYETPFIIPLQFLDGSDNEIIKTIQTYLEKQASCQH